jgi:predicted DNA-binding protein
MANRTKKEALQHVVPVRLTATLKEWLDKQSARRTLSVSDVVREAIIEKKERVEHGHV